MTRGLFMVVLTMAAGVGGGCSSRTSSHGDAVWKRPPLVSWVGGPVGDRLLLPEFSLGRAGEHRFRVRELPRAIVPGRLERRTHERHVVGGEGSGERRLPEFSVRVSVRRLDGTEVFSHMIGPGNARFDRFNGEGGGGTTRATYELPWAEERVGLRSYDVVVEVVGASSSGEDVGWLEGVDWRSR